MAVKAPARAGPGRDRPGPYPFDGRTMTRKRTYLIAAAGLLETLPVWLRTRRLGGNLIVRCRQGHLFTTLWIPGVSLKALRLGLWRLERCPVGHHWTVVTPVRASDLTDAERRTAREHHDIQLP
jgi:hypothetical protein